MYGAEVWQIPTREINNILSTEMDVLRRSARISRMERNKEWTYKGNNESERDDGHHRHHREEKTIMVWPRQKDVRGENAKINYEMDTRGEKKKKRRSKKRGWKEYNQP
jgi:hypothetical protein